MNTFDIAMIATIDYSPKQVHSFPICANFKENINKSVEVVNKKRSRVKKLKTPVKEKITDWLIQNEPCCGENDPKITKTTESISNDININQNKTTKFRVSTKLFSKSIASNEYEEPKRFKKIKDPTVQSNVQLNNLKSRKVSNILKPIELHTTANNCKHHTTKNKSLTTSEIYANELTNFLKPVQSQKHTTEPSILKNGVKSSVISKQHTSNNKSVAKCSATKRIKSGEIVPDQSRNVLKELRWQEDKSKPSSSKDGGESYKVTGQFTPNNKLMTTIGITEESQLVLKPVQYNMQNEESITKPRSSKGGGKSYKVAGQHTPNDKLVITTGIVAEDSAQVLKPVDYDIQKDECIAKHTSTKSREKSSEVAEQLTPNSKLVTSTRIVAEESIQVFKTVQYEVQEEECITNPRPSKGREKSCEVAGQLTTKVVTTTRMVAECITKPRSSKGREKSSEVAEQLTPNSKLVTATRIVAEESTQVFKTVQYDMQEEECITKPTSLKAGEKSSKVSKSNKRCSQPIDQGSSRKSKAEVILEPAVKCLSNTTKSSVNNLESINRHTRKRKSSETYPMQSSKISKTSNESNLDSNATNTSKSGENKSEPFERHTHKKKSIEIHPMKSPKTSQLDTNTTNTLKSHSFKKKSTETGPIKSPKTSNSDSNTTNTTKSGENNSEQINRHAHKKKSTETCPMKSPKISKATNLSNLDSNKKPLNIFEIMMSPNRSKSGSTTPSKLSKKKSSITKTNIKSKSPNRLKQTQEQAKLSRRATGKTTNTLKSDASESMSADLSKSKKAPSRRKSSNIADINVCDNLKESSNISIPAASVKSPNKLKSIQAHTSQTKSVKSRETLKTKSRTDSKIVPSNKSKSLKPKETLKTKSATDSETVPSNKSKTTSPKKPSRLKSNWPNILGKMESSTKPTKQKSSPSKTLVSESSNVSTQSPNKLKPIQAHTSQTKSVKSKETLKTKSVTDSETVPSNKSKSLKHTETVPSNKSKSTSPKKPSKLKSNWPNISGKIDLESSNKPKTSKSKPLQPIKTTNVPDDFTPYNIRLPTFKQIVRNKENTKLYQDKLQQIISSMENICSAITVPKLYSSPKKDSLELLGCDHLSEHEIISYFKDNIKYCHDIINNQGVSDRHADYNSGDITKVNSLKSSASMAAFSSKQILQLADLCQQNFARFDILDHTQYYFMVLVPEICGKIFMDVHEMGREEALHYLNNRPIPDFL